MTAVGYPQSVRGFIMDEKMRPILERVTAEHLFVDARKKAGIIPNESAPFFETASKRIA